MSRLYLFYDYLHWDQVAPVVPSTRPSDSIGADAVVICSQLLQFFVDPLHDSAQGEAVDTCDVDYLTMLPKQFHCSILSTAHTCPLVATAPESETTTIVVKVRRNS